MRKHNLPWYFNKPLWNHAWIHAITAFLLTAPYILVHHEWSGLLIGIIVGGTQFIIDACASTRNNLKENAPIQHLLGFLIHQILHLAVLVGIVRCVNLQAFLNAFASASTLMQGHPVFLTPLEKLLTTAIVVICTTAVSSVIVQIVTESMPRETAYMVDRKVTVTEKYETEVFMEKERRIETSYAEEPQQPLVPRGRMIGYLERLIVVFVVCVGAYSAIGFIVAAKSLARFKKLDHQEWAEYFLVGTLSSLLCGTLFGLILKLLLNIQVS